ncbi:His-Xaa-Ser system protein HxsD [Candidatus Pacearchaeota archaeon]|nr:His-Xaa-Ser system protein HxsD [Candidatus Pacearchaeota archaeon]
MEIHHEDNFVLIEINPEIYLLEVVYSAAYVFLDRAYIRLDGDADKKIIVELRPKEDYSLEQLKNEFNNELLNYAFHKSQIENSGDIRNILMQRALFIPEINKIEKDDLLNEEFSGDPNEIFSLEDSSENEVPWEE